MFGKRFRRRDEKLDNDTTSTVPLRVSVALCARVHTLCGHFVCLLQNIYYVRTNSAISYLKVLLGTYVYNKVRNGDNNSDQFFCRERASLCSACLAFDCVLQSREGRKATDVTNEGKH